MKPIFTTLLLVCSITSALSQEYKATFGKYTGCLRAGGICTITSPSSSDKAIGNTSNISFVYTENSTTVLRIHKNKLTQQEASLLLEKSIKKSSKNGLQFVMEEALPLSKSIEQQTARTSINQVQVLEAKAYPVFITDDYIDITITKENK